MNEIALTNVQTQLISDMAGFDSFQPNFILWALLNCEADTILIVSGNRAGKTASIVKNYILRIMGEHPIEKKNMRPDNPIRIIRMCSETLPQEADENGEVRNTIYPQIKQFLPPFLIKKDITIRKPVLTLYDHQGGKDIIIEFNSYNQEVQSQAGVPRWSIFEDEEAKKSIHEEQVARLILPESVKTGGDLIIGVTPVNKLTWLYEDVYQRAGVMYNSPHIINYLKKTTGIEHKTIEKLDGDPNIAVIRAATDDNPIYSSKDIEERMSKYDDVTTIEIRRYGFFHQMSGTIYKDFDPYTHVISRDKFFPHGMPGEWLHARGIDFHTHVNWACGWICLSTENEAFVYNEYNPSPDRFVTYEIAKQLIKISGDEKYKINLVDPTMAIKQPNTGLSALDDFNRFFAEFKRNGQGTGGYWETWDTKSERGRDIIKERLKNSRIIGRPFANRITKNGVESFLPTIWFLDNCQQTTYGFKNWRWEQWASREASATKEEKNKPEDKHSHFPVMLECIFKDVRFSMGRFKPIFERRSGHDSYFRTRV